MVDGPSTHEPHVRHTRGVARLRLGAFRRSGTVRLRITRASFTTRTVTVRVRIR
jgi:hypothetical protein